MFIASRYDGALQAKSIENPYSSRKAHATVQALTPKRVQTARLLMAGLLFAFVAEATCPPTPSAVQAADRFEVGLQIHKLLPNDRPDFHNDLPIYGPAVAAPIGPIKLQAQLFYGALREFSLYTVEG